MKRGIAASEAAAVLLVILLYLPVSGGMKEFLSAPSRPDAVAAFHGGGSVSGTRGDAVCSGPKCHPVSSHRKKGPTAAFLNHHEGVVSCLVCHARDPERGWIVPDPRGKGALRMDHLPGSASGNPHTAIGPPLVCERCHSKEGRAAIESAGVKGLPEGFESPIPLRMIQGGGRKWVPDDMR